MSLQAKYRDKIVGLVCTVMSNVDIYMLYSGVTQSSDNLKVVLKGREKIDAQSLEELKNILAIARTPYTITLVDFYDCDEVSKKEILKESIFFKRAINVVTREKIEEVANRLVEVYKPLEVYLFGSYVWGNPTKASDLDLLVVVPKSDEKSYKRSIKGYGALRGVDVSVDFLVYTKKEFEPLANDVTTLCYKVKKEGERIYAVS